MPTLENLQNLPIDITTTPLFQGVGLESVGVYLESCPTRKTAAGETLISPRMDHDELFIVMSGSFSVYLSEVETDALTTLQPGSCIGEMSIIENAPPSAYIVADKDSEVLVINEEIMWQLINNSHAIARNLLLILCERLRFDNTHIVNSDGIIEQYKRNAITDALTDLNNRHWMQDMFTRKINRAKSSATSLCLAMLDLDNFKTYNDTYGHQQGDSILRAVAASLRDLFRPTDLIARFGGDEFVVLLPDTNLEITQKIGDRVRLGILERLSGFGKSAADITVSVGISELAKADSLESLIERADAALYRAKSSGRNRVCQ